MKTRRVHRRLLATIMWGAAAMSVMGAFEVKDRDGRIEILDEGTVVFGWQHQNLREPKGGEQFMCSAFVHPLATPSGFVLTDVQPGDHLHHLGVWWPWKMVTVKGQNYVTWEMQKGEGRQVAVSAKIKSQSADKVVLEAESRHEIKPKDGGYIPVVKELTTMQFKRIRIDKEPAYQLDITIAHSPIGDDPVEITRYRYSGFSWRGTPLWNKDNSRMRTSGGHDRDTANGQEANWVMVDGPTKNGTATMLILSGAGNEGGTAERLRVWNSKMHHGMPFVNLNPVVKESILLTPAHKEVALRQYRIVVADREIPPVMAEAFGVDRK